MGRHNLILEIRDWILTIIVAVTIAFFIRTYVIELYLVEGPSMSPTLFSGQRLAVNKFIYSFRAPGRGEVLVFRYPSNPSKDFIKRVIAILGDTIAIKAGHVIINGQVLNEPYIFNETMLGSYPLTTIPAGHIFAMGDNRNNSEDSRFPDVGFVPYDLIKGKAMLIFWPLDKVIVLP